MILISFKLKIRFRERTYVEVFVKKKYTKMSRLKADSMNSTLCRHVFCFLSKLKGQNHVGMLTGFAFAFASALLLLHLLLPT